MSEEPDSRSRDQLSQPAALIPADSQLLREMCVPVPLDQIDELVIPHVYPMRDTLRTFNGIGLAAPQVGIALRFFLMLSEGRVSVVINPVIHQKLGVRRMADEGCLSFPDRAWTPVPRWEKVLLEWRKTDGTKRTAWFRGMEARIIQHETDHLDGICIYQ